MMDILDTDAVKESLRSAGLKFECCPGPEEQKRIINVFAKGGASFEVRGRRSTVLTDSDFGARMPRGVANAVIAGITGDPMFYVSGGWSIHQGPVGGGPVAAIVRV
jgi:cyanuric acid amidohydrolase